MKPFIMYLLLIAALFPLSVLGQTEERHDSLMITTPASNIRMCPNPNDSCAILFKSPVNEKYRILSRSEKSENIRSIGRHYWYQIEIKDSSGWVFGGNTSKSTEPVDCQCVDYLKHYFNLNRYTANAADWGGILLPELSEKNATQLVNIPYEYVKVDTPEVGDIVIFGRGYEYGSQNTKKYGHIGFFVGYIGEDLLVKGANHPEPITYHYTDEFRCNNISEKRYKNSSEITFYRRKE